MHEVEVCGVGGVRGLVVVGVRRLPVGCEEEFGAGEEGRGGSW